MKSCILNHFVEHGHSLHTIDLFFEMQEKGITPSRATFLCVLKACSNLKAINKGRDIHNVIMKNGLETDLFVCSSLIDMYAKCSLLGIAREVFDRVPTRDTVLWNVLIATYEQHGYDKEPITSLVNVIQPDEKDDPAYI